MYGQTSSAFEPFVAGLTFGRTFLLTQWFTPFIQAFVSLHVALSSKLPIAYITFHLLGIVSLQSLGFGIPPNPYTAHGPPPLSRPRCFCAPLALVHSNVFDVFPNHIPPSFPCPTVRAWLGQPAKQSGFGYSVVRHARKVAQPLQPPPLGLLDSSLCITPPSPRFSHSDTFSPLLAVGDSQYGPDTSVVECVQFPDMPPEWDPTLCTIQQCCNTHMQSVLPLTAT